MGRGKDTTLIYVVDELADFWNLPNNSPCSVAALENEVLCPQIVS